MKYSYAHVPYDFRLALIIGGVAMLVLAVLGLPIILSHDVRVPIMDPRTAWTIVLVTMLAVFI